jgi:transcriptional regulator with XRE-family HTH domain
MWGAVVSNNVLSIRRRQLGITTAALSRESGVPVATVNRILANPDAARFEKVAAVGRVLGVDFTALRKRPIRDVLRARAAQKARYVVRVVQGTQGLEAAGVDAAGYERLVAVATEALLSGPKRKLWDDD